MSTPLAHPAASLRHTGVVLAAVCLACFLLPISLTGASVALPDIGVDLSAGLAGVQWVINGYDLTFAAIMLAAGSLADRIGRQRIFVAGLAVFVVCSALSAAAPSILVLDLARAAAGIGAAGVLTSGSAILADTFQEGAGRARAFALLGTSFGLGIAFGPALSGIEVSTFGWRGVFASHALVAGLVLLTALRFVPESRNPDPGKFDWPGNIIFTASLSLVILVLVQGPQWGWTHPATLATVIGSLVLLAVFPVVERRHPSPMLDVSLLVNRRFVAISLVPVALAFGFTAVLILLPSYFSSVDGTSAGEAGLILMLMTAPTLVLPMVGGWLTGYTSNRVILVLSLLLTTVGAGWLTTVLVPGVSILALAAPLVLIGSGFGISLGILDGAAISTVETERAGMAAGMFNTMRLSSEVMAIAAMGSLAVTLTQTRLADGFARFAADFPGGSADLADGTASGDLAGSAAAVPAGAVRDALVTFAANGYTGAMHSVLWVVAGICLVTAIAAAALLTPRPASAAEAGTRRVAEDVATPV